MKKLDGKYQAVVCIKSGKLSHLFEDGMQYEGKKDKDGWFLRTAYQKWIYVLKNSFPETQFITLEEFREEKLLKILE